MTKTEFAKYMRKLERLLSKLKPLLDLEKTASSRRMMCNLDDGSSCTIVSARDQDGDVSHYLYFARGDQQ